MKRPSEPLSIARNYRQACLGLVATTSPSRDRVRGAQRAASCCQRPSGLPRAFLGPASRPSCGKDHPPGVMSQPYHHCSLSRFPVAPDDGTVAAVANPRDAAPSSVSAALGSRDRALGLLPAKVLDILIRPNSLKAFKLTGIAAARSNGSATHLCFGIALYPDMKILRVEPTRFVTEAPAHSL